MNRFKQLVNTVNTHKVEIITRTAVIGAGIIGVTLAAGLIKVTPTEKTVEGLEHVAKAARKAAE